MRRGIFGGTFDPPHLAHLLAGEAAYHQLDLDLVTFIPAGIPWQKADRAVTPAEQRRVMTELAVGGVDYFESDSREIYRDGRTYTIDTLESFPESEDLVLLLGADAAHGISTWHRSEALLARTQLAVLPRPGTDRDSVACALSEVSWRWLEAPELDISGSVLREMVCAGRSIRFLVPELVRKFILEHGLYVEA